MGRKTSDKRMEAVDVQSARLQEAVYLPRRATSFKLLILGLIYSHMKLDRIVELRVRRSRPGSVDGRGDDCKKKRVGKRGRLIINWLLIFLLGVPASRCFRSSRVSITLNPEPDTTVHTSSCASRYPAPGYVFGPYQSPRAGILES
ncbi:hypothetical protein BR93DRAFT_507429 [Coniochaeta sp. PMI_546]|nr:hypothetical protein BR93DRAFT_507429 [Coniochaeta sp. PMI_546]